MAKKPKKPKASAGLKTWQAFDERMKRYNAAISKKKSDQKKLESLKKKYS